MNERSFLRMAQWLVLAAVFYGCALVIQQPQIETAFWKLGHITSGAYLGYWIDAHLFGHYSGNRDQYTPRVMARAIIVGCAILGMAFGL